MIADKNQDHEDLLMSNREPFNFMTLEEQAAFEAWLDEIQGIVSDPTEGDFS